MIRITLTAEDRARLNVPEVIEYNELRPRGRELLALDRELGINYFEMGSKLAKGDPLADAILAWVALVGTGLDVSFEEANLDPLGTKIERVETEADPKE